jgi:hypothetical protein
VQRGIFEGLPKGMRISGHQMQRGIFEGMPRGMRIKVRQVQQGISEGMPRGMRIKDRRVRQGFCFELWYNHLWTQVQGDVQPEGTVQLREDRLPPIWHQMRKVILKCILGFSIVPTEFQRSLRHGHEREAREDRLRAKLVRFWLRGREEDQARQEVQVWG